VGDYESAVAAYDLKNGFMHQIMNDITLEKGLKILAWAPSGFGGIASKVKVIHPDNMKGLKFRAPGLQPLPLLYRHLGADSIEITWGELYTAIQTGVVDGHDNTIASTLDAFRDVTKYYTMTNQYWEIANHYVNLKKFNSLPPQYQKILLDEFAKLHEETHNQYPSMFKKMVKELSTYQTIIELSPEEMRPWIDKSREIYPDCEKIFSKAVMQRVKNAIK